MVSGLMLKGMRKIKLDNVALACLVPHFAQHDGPTCIC